MIKYNISLFQFALLLANFMIPASLISLPQVLTQISNQNTWMIPILVFPVFFLIFFLCLGKNVDPVQHSRLDKAFTVVIGVFLIFVYIRDLRLFIDYVSSYLLPTTPIEIISIVLTLTLLYVSAAGLEVIARITVIQFIVLAVVVLVAPILVINELDVRNITPIINNEQMGNLAKSSYLFFPWMGEALISCYLIRFLSKQRGIKKGVLLGSSLGFLLIFIVIIVDIAVLGEKIMTIATYPTLLMVQEINITDFLDRLDLILVTIWMPTLFSKLALALYCIVHSLFPLKDEGTKLIMTPVSLFLGILAIILFESNTMHLEFTFQTWTVIGLLLEILLIGLLIVSRIRKKIGNKKSDTEY
ncbi:GerAB/ArcD/ProY family transporter [Metabacillus sp. B2-18]|uniref:GerAB/ArcD/ProY family transporter n=1 Tax=Metabacillus sp. B2-18 TaxID=2897333 RepID=UPI001E4EEB66|nr:endospore germination permease [Metabacillus sp. B2-18]UGB32098.1 spore germination protein [Metabacillus sp. B2-18]